jgi:hypothetical protein
LFFVAVQDTSHWPIHDTDTTLVNRSVSFFHWEIPIIFYYPRNPYVWNVYRPEEVESRQPVCYSPVEMWWHTVTHGRGSEGETGK